MRAALLAASLSLVALRAGADPVPVHVALARGSGRSITAMNAERVQVGDVMAEILGGVAPEVLSATETRDRITALNPSAAHCDALDCITAITLPLHARALILVRVNRGRDGTARIDARYVNLRGEVLAERSEQDIAPTSTELIALARLTAGSLAESVRGLEAPPAVPPPPAPPAAAAPTPAPALIVARAAPRIIEQRRMVEVWTGVGVIALGVGAITGGAVGLATDERVTQNLSEERVLVERPSGLNWIWVGVGALAAGAGTFLIIDGMRPRPATIHGAAVMPVSGGAMLSAGGSF